MSFYTRAVVHALFAASDKGPVGAWCPCITSGLGGFSMRSSGDEWEDKGRGKNGTARGGGLRG